MVNVCVDAIEAIKNQISLMWFIHCLTLEIPLLSPRPKASREPTMIC